MALGALGGATASVSKYYQSAQSDLAQALARLGSQRRFQTASQDSTGYIKANNLQVSRAQYEGSKASVSRGQGFVDLADGWVSNMLDQLADLKGAINGGNYDEAEGILNSIAAGSSATYGSNNLDNLGATFDTVRLADGSQLALQMDSGTSSALTTNLTGVSSIGSSNASTVAGYVDTAISNMETAAQSLAKYGAQLDSQSAFLSDMIENTRSAESAITAIDEASEMARYTEADIRQQTSLAMISQGNMSKRSILALYM